MRRGLMAWDKAELPVSTIEARLAALRKGMKAEKLDGFIAYTNIARPAAVSWLSGFTPYWSQGLYFVPAEGDPQFATALSKRVAEWIGGVMAVGEVIATPRPGAVLGKHLSDNGIRKVGILELDDFPAEQANALLKEAPATEFVDATSVFAPARAQVDEAERNLMKRAAALAADCMKMAGECDTKDPQTLFSTCEGHARKAGAEDVFLSVIPDLKLGAAFHRADTAGTLGGTFALRISLAYKAAWVRLTQSFASDETITQAFAGQNAALDSIGYVDASEPGAAIGEIFSQAGGKLVHWRIEQPSGGYPLSPVAGSDMAAGGFHAHAPFVLSVETDVDGHRWVGAKAIV